MTLPSAKRGLSSSAAPYMAAEARLAASVWVGSTAALRQALPVVPQGVERLAGGSCLDTPLKEAQRIRRELGVSHGVMTLGMRAAVQVGITNKPP
eukprot:2962245-Alexandrium_andersonii.AAC.1